MTFLESYVEGAFVPKEFFVTGFSMGGHVTWDMLANDSRVSAGVIISGSPDLSAMLKERLSIHRGDSEGLLEGASEWPTSIAKLYVARDRRLEGMTGKKLLLLHGTNDALVPLKFVTPWIERFGGNNDVVLIQKEETGHWVSRAMMDDMTNWILDVVA